MRERIEINKYIMDESKSKTILSIVDTDEEDTRLRPTLFVCYGHAISEYRLEGRQSMGRPSGDYIPDIPIHARFISRDHGYFVTENDKTSYIASQTTNPIRYRGTDTVPDTRLTLKDGDELIIPWTDRDGKDMSVILVYAQTRARINLWRELQKASRDSLTNLSDRESFITWWKQNREKKDYSEAVLFILDVDDFKKLNDTAGHNAGDVALCIIAGELKNAVRYENQICRWGGDEFVGIIPSGKHEALHRLNDIGNAICEATAASGVPVSVSIGYTDIHEVSNSEDVEALIGLADKALYRVKSTSKNGIAAYS